TNSVGVSGSDSLAVRVDTSTAVVWVGAGDIDDRTTNGDAQTANLLANIAGTVFAVGTTRIPTGRPPTSPTATTRPGAPTRPAPGRYRATTSTQRRTRRGTSDTSARPRAIRRKGTTATTWAPGTSSPSTARSTSRRVRRRCSGC